MIMTDVLIRKLPDHQSECFVLDLGQLMEVDAVPVVARHQGDHVRGEGVEDLGLVVANTGLLDLEACLEHPKAGSEEEGEGDECLHSVGVRLVKMGGRTDFI